MANSNHGRLRWNWLWIAAYLVITNWSVSVFVSDPGLCIWMWLNCLRERDTPAYLWQIRANLTEWAQKLLMNIRTRRLQYLFLYWTVQTKLKIFLYCLNIRPEHLHWGRRALYLVKTLIPHSPKALQAKEPSLLLPAWKMRLYIRNSPATSSHLICSWLARNK